MIDLQDTIRDHIRKKYQDATDTIVAHLLPKITKEEHRIPDKVLKQSVTRVFAAEFKKYKKDELGIGTSLKYDDVYQFVDKVIRRLYANEHPQNRWCDHWMEHPEVMRRFEAMWATYEKAIAEDKSIGEEKWIREIGDYHMRYIQASDGPFFRCLAYEEHSQNEPLPTSEIALQETTESE